MYKQKEETSSVIPGIEVFLKRHLDWVKDKKVGLMTNPTGVNRNLTSDIDLLHQHENVHLTALYGPEHGIRGNQEGGETVETYRDGPTGLPVYSLYGDTWKPNKEMLENIDVLIFDIQDIGSNVYTYIYSLGFLMEAAAEHNKEVIVLDRPNPIGGIKVEGPVRSQDAVSFMGRFLLPVRHGMTIGELAYMWNNEYNLGVNLKIAQMQGWKRGMYFEDTNLPWVMTSPNIPTVESAYLYAGTELLEDTTLCKGVGTTRPFELVGAPWVNGEALEQEMGHYNLSGVVFRSAYFTPMHGRYQGKLMGGVQVHITNPRKINLVSLGMHLMKGMRKQSEHEFAMDSTYFHVIGKKDSAEMIQHNQSVETIIASWTQELKRWMTDVRSQYLLYNS